MNYMNWWNISSPKVTWLVDGLIPADGHTALVGKPKAGKSTACRQLAVCVVKSRPFLGRSTDLPPATGRVLYTHLDRKDRAHKVVAEFKRLGMTEEESSRLRLRTAQDLPSDLYEERLAWLKKEITEFRPDLVIIDLMWQFVVAKNANDYNAVVVGINKLQDALTQANYKGALVVTLHSRKATNEDDPADDILGSTGQRGSFSTLLFFKRYRNRDYYTVMSDQTERDEVFGEIDETIVTQAPDGTLVLGQKVSDLRVEQRKQEQEENIQRVLRYVYEHPGCTQHDLIDGLKMGKPTLLHCVKEGATLMTTRGSGVKGDPICYYINGAQELADVDQAGSQSPDLDPATQDTGTEAQAVVIAKVADDKQPKPAVEPVGVTAGEPEKLPVELPPSPISSVQPDSPAVALTAQQNLDLPSTSALEVKVNRLETMKRGYLVKRERNAAEGCQSEVDKWDRVVALIDAQLAQLQGQIGVRT